MVLIISRHVSCYNFQTTVRRIRGSFAFFTIRVSYTISILFLKLKIKQLDFLKLKKNLKQA